jgi:uncharacterized protein YjbI with pentapeptide repeats
MERLAQATVALPRFWVYKIITALRGSEYRGSGAGGMGGYRVRHRNAKFANQKIDLDGKSFSHCEFENCIIVLETGDTELSGCTVKNCKLMLRGNAYTVGKIIRLFTGKSPLKVLDLEESLFEKPEE